MLYPKGKEFTKRANVTIEVDNNLVPRLNEITDKTGMSLGQLVSILVANSEDALNGVKFGLVDNSLSDINQIEREYRLEWEEKYASYLTRIEHIVKYSKKPVTLNYLLTINTFDYHIIANDILPKLVQILVDTQKLTKEEVIYNDKVVDWKLGLPQC